MSIISGLREHPDSGRLFKRMLMAGTLWLIGAALFGSAVSMNMDFRQNLKDADDILKAGAVVNASPILITNERDILSEISDIAKAMGIQVSQLGASSSGITFTISEIDTGTFTSFVRNISERGIPVKNAELKALSSKGNRRLSVSMSLEGNSDEGRKNNYDD